MGKYDRLGSYLREQNKSLVPMTFAEVERVIGFALPKSQQYQAWWSNSTSNNVMTQVWLDAGYRTEQVDIDGKRLVFRRVGLVTPPSQPASGLSDWPRDFRLKEPTTDRVSLFGALKGTFSIEPGWDLTKPALEDELDIDRTADLVDSGLRTQS